MSTSRRGFIRGLAGAGLFSAGGTILPGCFGISNPRLAGDKLNVGVIGAGGKGWSDWTPMFLHGENIAAICDVDRRAIA